MQHAEIDMPEPTKLAIAGDWHGNHNWGPAAIQYAARNHAEVLIQVGDFGFWRKGWQTEDYLRRIEEAGVEEGVKVYWLDGNHEDHTRRDEFNSPDRPNTVYLPRGHRWEWWGKRFMALGGAFSIDRFMRKEGISWWPEELISDEELDWACHQPHGMDVILTHDCPAGVNIPGIGPDSKPRGGADSWPPAMLYQAGLHRMKLKEVYKRHKPQLWYHGHYHVPHETWYGETTFVGLDMDATTMRDNVHFITAADLK